MNELQSFAALLWMVLENPRTGVLLVLLVTAACADIRSYRIPNWLTGGGLVAGLVLATWHAPAPGYALLMAIAGAAVGFAALFPLYMLHMLGAGDVKLMAMVGAFLGLPGTLYALACVLIAGGFVAFMYASGRRTLVRLLLNVQQIVMGFVITAVGGGRAPGTNNFPSVGRMPYAIGICAGTGAYVLASQAGWLR